MENEPDFRRVESKFSWEINMPTILTALGMCGAGIIAYGNSQVERNDMKWQIREHTNDIESMRKSQDAMSAAVRALSDSVAATNRTVDHLSQVIDWNFQNPQPQRKTP